MERFRDKKNYVSERKKYGRQENELNFSQKKKKKELDFKNHLW